MSSLRSTKNSSKKSVILEKRSSKYCNRVKSKISYASRFILVVFLLLLIIPILYLIPCNTTYLVFKIASRASFQPFTFPSLTIASQQYHNMTIVDNNTSEYNDWKIKSIELYFNPYTPNLNRTEMMKHVLDHEEKPLVNYFELNSLKVIITSDFYENQIGISQILSINGFYHWYNLPVDYQLSYLKISIIPIGVGNSESFTVDFYHFFQGENRTELKLMTNSEVILNGLIFNNNTYSDFYNWKFNGGIIPNVYPYDIDLSVRRYNQISNFFGVESL